MVTVIENPKIRCCVFLTSNATIIIMVSSSSGSGSGSGSSSSIQVIIFIILYLQTSMNVLTTNVKTMPHA